MLIRDVPAEDLDEIRSAAAQRGTSLQSYLRDAVHAQAVHERRRSALARTAEHLRGLPQVPAAERRAVLDAIEAAHAQRGDELSDRPAP